MAKLSIVVPAYNEGENLRETCQGILRYAPRHLEDFEILVVDDASSDGTWDIAQELQRQNPKVRAFRNETNMGLGFNYSFGVGQAAFSHAMMIPGDSEITAESYRRIFEAVAKEDRDVWVTYIANPVVRPIGRRIISRCYVRLFNRLFDLDLPYYNGINVIRTDLVKGLGELSAGFGYMSSIVVRLLKRGHSHACIGFFIKKRKYGKSKAFHPKNVARVISGILALHRQVRSASERA